MVKIECQGDFYAALTQDKIVEEKFIFVGGKGYDWYEYSGRTKTGARFFSAGGDYQAVYDKLPEWLKREFCKIWR